MSANKILVRVMVKDGYQGAGTFQVHELERFLKNGFDPYAYNWKTKGLFSGKYDALKNQVFEGDILVFNKLVKYIVCKERTQLYSEHIGIVVRDDGEFKCTVYHNANGHKLTEIPQSEWNRSTVIGNIFQKWGVCPICKDVGNKDICPSDCEAYATCNSADNIDCPDVLNVPCPVCNVDIEEVEDEEADYLQEAPK